MKTVTSKLQINIAFKSMMAMATDLSSMPLLLQPDRPSPKDIGSSDSLPTKTNYQYLRTLFSMWSSSCVQKPSLLMHRTDLSTAYPVIDIKDSLSGRKYFTWCYKAKTIEAVHHRTTCDPGHPACISRGGQTRYHRWHGVDFTN
jgi:hypothetical protein